MDRRETGVGCERAFELCDGEIVAAACGVSDAEIVDYAQRVGLAAQQGLEVGNGFVRARKPEEGECEVESRVGEIRARLQHLFEMRERLSAAPGGDESRRVVVARFEVVGVQPESRLVVRERF